MATKLSPRQREVLSLMATTGQRIQQQRSSGRYYIYRENKVEAVDQTVWFTTFSVLRTEGWISKSGENQGYEFFSITDAGRRALEEDP